MMKNKLANLVTVIGIFGTCSCLPKLYDFLNSWYYLWGGKH